MLRSAVLVAWGFLSVASRQLVHVWQDGVEEGQQGDREPMSEVELP